MTVENSNGATVLTGGSIEWFRKRVLWDRLGFEILGMTCHGPSAYTLLKRAGYTGSRDHVYAVLSAELGKEPRVTSARASKKRGKTQE